MTYAVSNFNSSFLLIFSESSKTSLVDRLRKMQRLYSALIKGVKSNNDYLNPLLLCDITVTVLQLILSSYLLFMIWINWQKQNEVIWHILQFRTFCIVISVIYASKCAEDLLKPVSAKYIIIYLPPTLSFLR